MALPAIAPYPMPTAAELPGNRVAWKADPARAILLVHDMQNHFLAPFPGNSSPLTDLLHNVSAVKETCVRLGVPVLYSAQPGGQTPRQRGLQQDFWGPGVPDEEHAVSIASQVAPVEDDVMLIKWKYSAFVRTDLAERMEAAGADQLLLVGVYAHIGVLMTACDAWMRDIQAFVVADAVADFSADDHRLALEWAASQCAYVTTAQALAGLGAEEEG
ncbi:isochorismatase family protein [Streptomyces sp. HNM0575]|uniref:isochorismatase family protein n=1 Tax=Streptomyces sp. HNM0575 TaxID=2716338 RepID=UPI00145D20DC|nr:isochorismatase family protein [Streptomyces sp. HNM0575]NLU73364.1 isochorismatase family protein [Streptomyces sp. HNM0575]